MSIPILIIDDEPYMRILLEQTLEELGGAIALHQARDGQEGLDVARQCRPRLIFLDIMMPMIGGLELCRILRQDEAFRETVIVLLTARGEEGTNREDGLACGADHYVAKPFDPDDIVALTRQLLQLPA
jgi:two-component system, OmpR family, alkaline phosphatase synthesis response regulator PhoP